MWVRFPTPFINGTDITMDIYIMKKEAYINENTPELRNWLKGQGLIPETYPDCCDYNGLTAPYPNSFGEMIMYKDGVRYEEDDDFEEFIICENEEMFKETVIELLNRQHENKRNY